ncbi:AAA family ATPase [bacterium]|nr:AAA family ATPase [bacterium]
MMPLFPDDRELFLFTGNYGSGKTEVSVNVATTLARAGVKPLTIADLDLVNPYFRCREAREPMEELGVRVVAPGGDMHNADLPILLPEVLGAIRNREGVTLLDVGGDNVGATVLASLKPMLTNRPHEMLFVLNQNRPFTDTIDGAMRLMDEIEVASRLKVTGVVGNTHLMDQTDLEMAKQGAEFCRLAAEKRGVKVGFVTCPELILRNEGLLPEDYTDPVGVLELEGFDAPVLPLRRIMLPPWMGGPAPGSMATHSRDGFARLIK